MQQRAGSEGRRTSRNFISESESDEEELNVQALPVVGGPLPFVQGEIADNANDYLRQVRWEAGKISDVLVSDRAVEEPQKILSKDYTSIFELANERFLRHDALLKALPEAWRSDVVEEFKSLRACIDKVRTEAKENKNALADSLHDIQVNILDAATFFASAEIFMKNFNETDPNHQIAPSLSILINCDYVKCCKLVEVVMEQVDQMALEKDFVITYHKALWIYSLLAMLDLPLLLDFCGILNQLKKGIIASYERYDESYADCPQYRVMMATLLVIIVDFFRP